MLNKEAQPKVLLIVVIPFNILKKAKLRKHSSYQGSERRSTAKRLKLIFWTHENVVYHDWDDDYTTAYISQNLSICTLKIGELHYKEIIPKQI